MQTSTLTRTVVGVFDDDSTAQRAVQALSASGYSRDQIEVTHRDAYTEESNRTEGGGISGWFRRLFGSDDDEDQRVYSEAVTRGHSVVCVQTPEGEENRAADIMNEYGAVDIDHKRKSWMDDDRSTVTANIRSTTGVPVNPRTSTNIQEERSIPVVEEQLRVGKRAVQRGGVRVYNRVLEQPVEQNVNLREERVRIDRRSADRPATDADLRLRDEVIEVTETAEEPVVEKRTRVVEEVVVGKEVNNRTETIRDTVRRTDVNVEHLGADASDYGYRMASDQRYRGRTWDEVESDLRSDYERTYPGSKWEQFKDSVRRGWDKVAH